MKENIDKLDFIKIKSFCFAKDTAKTMRRPEDWEKKFVKHEPDKDLLPKIYKKL